MNFKLKATVENLVGSGQHAKGPWFLYAVKESIGQDKTKTWRLFYNLSLSLGATYHFEGYISESPNKGYTNPAGKNPYQTTYNATLSHLVEDLNQSQSDFGPEPVFDTNAEIPF